MGEKLRELVGHREKSGVMGIERRKRALVGLSKGWAMSGWLQPPQSLPCLERSQSRGVWCSGEKMHKENIFDVNVNVF